MAVAFPKIAQLPGAARRSRAVVLLAIVATSYRQTIHAYPNGGGAYVVSKENIIATGGPRRRRVAARRLHADRRGLDLLGRARHRLRGALRSGRTTAASLLCLGVPRPHDARQPARREGGGQGLRGADLRCTSSLLFSLLVVGLARVFGFDLGPIAGVARAGRGVRRRARASRPRHRLFVLLRAFSSGAVVLSGVEAISNGVPAFRKPESKNAARTLTLMGDHPRASASSGICVLAHHLRPVVDEGGETVLSQMGKAVFG